MSALVEEANEEARKEHERKVRARFKSDFAFYGKHCLKIRLESGKVAPLLLNEYQAHIHAMAEKQRAETGRVRLIVLKARQGGVSTYVQGRAYHRVTHSRGTRAFILTHSDAATQNIFGIAKRFDQNCPEPVHPRLSVSNANELNFGDLDSGYKVATAKAVGVGRSDTIQFFHGSEVAFWSHADEHAAGALQAVPEADGTEIWLESTGNGMGGYFYNVVQAALAGTSDYELAFLPWFWLSKYRREPASGFSVPEKWREYADLHGISDEQLCWAYHKSADLAIADKLPTDQPCARFKQEYPATVEEAFQAGDERSFIHPDLVLRARKATPYRDERWPTVLGVDVARGGGDKTRIIDRTGRRAGEKYNKVIDTDDLMEVVAESAFAIKATGAAMCCIDVTGLGSGVYDRLVERKLDCIIIPVNYAAGARDKGLYLNKRAEIWGLMRDWLDDEGGASIPDDELLQNHLCAPQFKRNSNEQIVLEAKEKIKERLGFSPDGGDALANTFAEPVADYDGGLAGHKPDEHDTVVPDELDF